MITPADSPTKVCPECGAVFKPRNAYQLCCSEKCKLDRRRRQNRRRQSGDKDEGPFSSAIRMSKMVSNETIMKARKKPAGVSDIRWQIELRRRASRASYDNRFTLAPDPDDLKATALG